MTMTSKSSILVLPGEFDPSSKGISSSSGWALPTFHVVMPTRRVSVREMSISDCCRMSLQRAASSELVEDAIFDEWCVWFIFVSTMPKKRDTGSYHSYRSGRRRDGTGSSPPSSVGLR